jgi:hypothetical protein
MTPAISVTGLTRRYPDHVALDDVHLTIGTETITGLLGRNDAKDDLAAHPGGPGVPVVRLGARLRLAAIRTGTHAWRPRC